VDLANWRLSPRLRAIRGRGVTEPVSPLIDMAAFDRIDVRVGTVVEATPFPEARKPAIKLLIDFGPEIGRRKSSAQIVHNHRPEELVGRQVLAVINFPPRQIGKFMSEVLTLGVPDADGQVMLIGPDRPVPAGGRLY
jgi:tRNA-binding protein